MATAHASFTSIAVDSAAKAYVGGYTNTSDFLSTPGAYRASASLLFSTFLGGNGASSSGGVCGNIEDAVYAVALDGADDIYVAGSSAPMQGLPDHRRGLSEDRPEAYGLQY